MAGGSIAYRPLTFIMYNKMLHALCQFFFNKMYSTWTGLQIHAWFMAFLACNPSFAYGFCITCSLKLQSAAYPSSGQFGWYFFWKRQFVYDTETIYNGMNSAITVVLLLGYISTRVELPLGNVIFASLNCLTWRNNFKNVAEYARKLLNILQQRIDCITVLSQ